MKTLDDLPKLPFEQVLSYLNLHDRLMLSPISRSCHEKIANSRVKFLCYSERPSGCIRGKNRWVSGAFAEHFIRSSRFESFFGAYARTVLSELKHLRLCDLSLDLENRTAFTRTLKSFIQLEELDIIRARCSWDGRTFKLTVPMLTSIHLEELKEIQMLTLDAPRLRKVKLLDCYDLRLKFVHGKSIESFISMSSVEKVTLEDLRNLKYLHKGGFSPVNETFLSSMKSLKEFHTDNRNYILNVIRQKKRYSRTDLKIYLGGLLLNGPDDLARNSEYMNIFKYSRPSRLSRQAFGFLAEHPWCLADEIPFYRDLHYSAISRVAPGLEVDVMRRFTELCEIKVTWLGIQGRNIQRFLDLLKNFENIVQLYFEGGQPQDLFNRLPEHCAVQNLFISRKPSDLRFLLRMKHLIHLVLCFRIGHEFVRKAFQKLHFLSSIKFKGPATNWVTIEIVSSRQFRVSAKNEKTTFSNLNAAITSIFGERPQTVCLVID